MPASPAECPASPTIVCARASESEREQTSVALSFERKRKKERGGREGEKGSERDAQTWPRATRGAGPTPSWPGTRRRTGCERAGLGPSAPSRARGAPGRRGRSSSSSRASQRERDEEEEELDAPLHDPRRDVPDPLNLRLLEQPPVALEKALVDKVVRLDARKRVGERRVVSARQVRRVDREARGRHLPARPGAAGAGALGVVGRGEALAAGGQEGAKSAV